MSATSNISKGIRSVAVRHWSQNVTAHSNALDLEPDLFKKQDPHEIALSLKYSAEHSQRRRGTAFQSAMSMLTFYLNRAGRDVDDKQRMVLERAKDELRDLFGKKPTRSKAS